LVAALQTELGVPFTSTTVFYDNQSVVIVGHSPIIHARTKNMEIDLFFVREKVLAKKLIVKHIPGDDQWADILTKSVSSAKFLSLLLKLNVEAAPIGQQPT
jgi:ABC-type taurine transport system substrate-binding protein